MKKNSLLVASITLVAFCFVINNSFANDEYANLRNAIQNGEQQDYTLQDNANSDGGSGLGNINSSKTTFTIDGSGYSVIRSGKEASGISVNEGQSLIMKNISSFADFVTRDSNTAGAITNRGTLTVDGVNFIGNAGYDISNKNKQRDVTGGAIYNLENGVISIVNSTFQNNHTYNWADKFSDGGAIFNRGLIQNLEADFTGNFAVGNQDRPNFMTPYQHSTAAGGAIANHLGTIENLVGDFTGNSAYSSSRNAAGGAIYNTGSITMNGGSFNNNYVQSEGADYTGLGGAIYNEGTFVAIDTDFLNNSASDNGGAIYNKNGTIEIYAKGKDVNLSGNTIGATYTINDDKKITNAEGGSSNAIYNEGETFLNLKAEEGKSITIQDKVSKADDANLSVTVNGDGQNGSLNIENIFDATNITLGGGEMKVSSSGQTNSTTVAVNNGTLNIEGVVDASEKVDLNNGTIHVQNGSTLKTENLNLSGGTLKLEDDLTNVTVVNATSGSIDLQDDTISNRNLGDISLNGDVNLNIDVDFTTSTGDIITANIVNPETTNSLIIDTINIIAYTDDLPSSSIQVIDTAISNYVKLADSYVINGGNPTLSYLTTYDKTLGTLDFDYGKDLATSILMTNDSRSYNMAGNESAPEVGFQTMGGNNSTLTISGNGYNINGNGNSGFTIDSGNTLVLNDVGAVSGFKKQTTDDASKGGAFNLNNGNLGDLSSTISNNTAISTNNDAMGGAIYTTGSSKIGKIKSLFTGNKAQGVNAMGGAIYNESDQTMAIEDATFTNNTTVGSTSSKGGAIYNKGTLEISANTKDVAFKGNKAKEGGAIYNEGTVNLTSSGDNSVVFYDDINGNNGELNVNNGTTEFHNNVAGNNINVKSGVVNVISNQNDININNGKIDVTAGNSINFNADKKITVSSEITGNGTINLNNDSVVSTNVTVNGDGSAVTSKAGAPTNGSIDFNNEIVAKAINSYNGLSTLNKDTTVDDLNIYGGEISVNSAILNVANNVDNQGILSLISKSTANIDKLSNTNGTLNLTGSNLNIQNQDTALNGTINILGSDSNKDVTNIAINGTNKDITGTLNVGDLKNSSVQSTLNLKNGNITKNAILNIASGNALNISGEGTVPDVYIDGDTDTMLGDVVLTNGNLTLENMETTLGDTKTTEGGSLPYYSQTNGNLSLVNSNISTKDSSLISGGDLNVDNNSTFTSLNNGFTVDNLTLSGTLNAMNGNNENYAVNNSFNIGDGLSDNQADFAINLGARSNVINGHDSFGSDTTTFNATNGVDAVINLSDWQLSGDIYGYDAPIDRNITLKNIFNGNFNGAHDFTFTSTDKEVLTPIGYYKINPLGGGDYSVDLTGYNPYVYRGQVTTIAQYQNQLAIDDMLFGHTMLDNGFKGNDNLSLNPNRYASANDLFAPYQYSRKDGGLWMKNYSTFEKLNMNQGLSVGNIAYGTLIGADFGLKELKKGWSFMPTAYVGYNGAHQYWDTAGAYQNGGQLGLMGTWYKNNFLIGALAYGGIYGNKMSTPRGNDNTFNYFVGAATKTAYNLKLGKDWSLQPNLLVAYNYFGQENWHTDFGQMGMMSGMLHGVNIAPGVNLIWEKETFSTYLTLQYMYNINQSSGGRAGNVYLPNIHMDRGYIQYGIGVNKKFTNRFSGYVQAVMRNVGRTGAGFQLGFEWLMGKKTSKK